MRYVISEATTGEVIKVYSELEDAIGSDYFYFKHLADSKKKSYKDGDKVFTITEDDELTIL